MDGMTPEQARQAHATLIGDLAHLGGADYPRPAMSEHRREEILQKDGLGPRPVLAFKQRRSRQIRSEYERRLIWMIRRLARGQINSAEFRDAAFDLTVEAYWDAFGAGREAGGVDQEVWVYSHEGGIVATQVVWAVHSIDKILGLLAPGFTDGDLQEALRRPSAMASTIEELWYEGLASAADDPMYEWIIGSTKEHCTDCLAYHGQRHRLRQWIDAGAVPQSYGLECHGFKCQCELQRSRGREIGTLMPLGSN